MSTKEASAKFSFFVAIISLLVTTETESARILAVFPTPSISHQVVFRPITQELARRGHEVIVITTDPAFPKGKTPANLTEIDVHNLSYKLWKELSKTATGKSDDIIKQVELALTLLTNIFERQVQTQEIQKVIQNREQKFDLLLTELCARPSLIFSHIFKAPVIQISSLGAFIDTRDILGAPSHPIIYPTPLRQKLNNLTIWNKITELYNHYKFTKVFYEHDKLTNLMLKRVFGKDAPDVKDLMNNVHMVFLNIHPVWEGNFPVPPSIVYIGGIHQNPVKELPKDLKSHLDSAKNGVIYMSFGTNTDPSLLPPEKKQIFFKVLSESPYEVLWKWNTDDVPGHAKNIRYSKWFPQSDLLRHPNVKLFITQGGLQSTDETITAGVPIIGIPMLGDQWFNVEKNVYHGIGVKLDLDTLTEQNFKEAIDKVIGDDSYRKNVLKLRSVLEDQPIKPLDNAVFWAEHVIRHSGAKHLRAPAANMSWREYLELDLILISLATVLSVLIISIIFGYHVISVMSNILNQIKVKKA